MAQRRIDRDAWEIFIGDEKNCVTLEFKLHQRKHFPEVSETTLISGQEIKMGVLKALAEALQEMGVLQENGTTTELKATKYHLEDMRKLVFK